MRIFSGSSNKPLAEQIAKELGISLSPLELHVFPDGETRVQVQEKVLDEDTVVVQSTSTPADHNYMELFFIVDALKRSGAKSVTAVIPYLGYQRQDHIFRDGEAVSLQVIVQTLEAVGVDTVIGCDFHTIRVPELFHIPVMHLSALPLFAEKIRELSVRNFVISSTRERSHEDLSVTSFLRDDNTVLVSPDRGGIRRIKLLSEMLDNMPFAVIEKNRDLSSGFVTAENIEGELAKRALIIDDMITSGKTMIAAAQLLQQKGAEEMHAFATHPVFSDDAKRLLDNSDIKKIYVTDTVFIPENRRPEKLEVLSFAKSISTSLQKS